MVTYRLTKDDEVVLTFPQTNVRLARKVLMYLIEELKAEHDVTPLIELLDELEGVTQPSIH